ncbi:DUF4296 domain-containing protein [Flavobacterium columnare]|uniref:Lipoprotein n=1 Tax=Flavobacterium columnare (strain ATCC 49512 / CIP 103533 / TG 44/87) TaxID=1041826 RepID=G8XBS0_FLACA|nr:DUF4296 domain-containing protein [Flavobacterium columnare]AEW87485.1 lipoprotein precursor [Flavobacterium columnare ATCC 49512]PTD13767.1 DUF4296 domain-containing protein [Flavobacterium columnare]QOG90126.1 DUF4296 domain-containing protein [Flavobacterium columnare]QOG92782.1 DUF4296 domain-containing protein [Flavobacterium columnare]QOG95447.1 DUF4296 domain-containing protein [Flavobacterium columnare]
MNKIACFFLIIFFLSCQNAPIKEPNNLIDEATMEKILYDLALIQAIKGHDAKLLPKNQIDPQKYVYKKYHIDSLQLVNSNKYYSSDIVNYKKMYDHVIEKIKTEKIKTEKLRQTELKKEKLKKEESSR